MSGLTQVVLMRIRTVAAALDPAASLFLMFMLSGLPAFVMAVPLNWLLVTRIGVPRAPAYAGVLVLQMTVNFVICRRLVFKRSDKQTLLSHYLAFLTGNSLIRSADWAFYSLVVTFHPHWFLLVQVGNVAVFAVMKFLFARFIFTRANHKL